MKKRFDAWDGKPLVRYWKPNTFLRQGEKVLAKKPRKNLSVFHPEWTHDIWTGEFEGYGRDDDGGKLFRTMKNAVAFAASAYRCGFRRQK